MDNIRKSLTNVLAAVTVVLTIAAIAIWQFYQFIIFKGSNGLVDMQGGRYHLWWAVGAALVACVAGFFVFSMFLRHDEGDDLHITS
jgi:uncharacterized membrane protein